MLTYGTEYNGEPIEGDNLLQPCEKETGLWFSNASREVHINTHQRTIMQHLLRCDYFEITERVYPLWINLQNPIIRK